MEVTTTSNGYEIKRPTETLDDDTYVSLIEKFGITGSSPVERLQALKGLSNDRIATLLTGINKGLQGSKDHLVHRDGAMKVGEKETIAPEYRYDIFTTLLEDIKELPDDINPERVGDTLAMAIVLLHPFEDGNGRTARIVSLTLRDGFDNLEERKEDFDALSEPRDLARARGGFLINGFTPRFPEGFDQSDPAEVSGYLHGLLTNEDPHAYYGPYAPSSLKRVS